MAYDIRPLSFGEILDRAFRVYLDNFALLFGISAVVWIPSGLLNASAGVVGARAAAILNGLFLIVAGPVLNAALTIGVAEAYLDRPVSIGEAYQATRPILLPIIGTYLLIGLIFVVPAAVVGGVTFMLWKPLFIIAMFALAAIAIYFAICWSLLGPVMIVERHYAMTALRRSRELVVGSWWRTFGILFTAGLIANIPSTALSFIWAFIPVIGAILTAATQAVSSTYGQVALMVYYIDRRCRTEDFDLRLLAEQVRAEGHPSMTSAPGSSSIA
jgi:hypothetical protein